MLKINRRTPFRVVKSFSVFIFFILLMGCKRGDKNESKQDTSRIESVNPLGEESSGSPESPITKSIIEYHGAIEDEIRMSLQNFVPFEQIRTLVEKSISVRDSLAQIHNMKLEFTPKDSLVLRPHEIRAYAAILEYKRTLNARNTVNGKCPSLLDLTRNTAQSDSSFQMLPKAKPSKFFSSGNFFFLGGGPFMTEMPSEDNVTFKDEAGKPEVRFFNNNTENGNYILNSIYYNKKNTISVTFGKSLESYYGFPRDVNGVGSLIHEFTERIPVYFMIESGVVPGHIISIKLKLVPESLGCRSDQPSIEFACSKNISASDILGVYIPYTSAPLTSCSITHQGNELWTADVDADGVPDLAAVSSPYEGMASGGVLAQVIWFVNINGEWKIIDYASENDCT